VRWRLKLRAAEARFSRFVAKLRPHYRRSDDPRRLQRPLAHCTVDEELTAREFHPPDAAKLKVLPAGSFYTEPANLLHFIEIREETVLQVSGIGPSGRHFIAK
jgi:hypothetical protein